MKSSYFSALVSGYGVPEDIITDKNYFSYLTQVFNFLFDRFANSKGTIVLSGGSTDCFSPFKRTEAREMKKWFGKKIREVQKETEQKIPWKFVLDNKALSTVENLLFFKPFAKGKIFIFAEKTRTARVKKLAQKIFTNKINLIFFDFDASFTRYHKNAIKKRETGAIATNLPAAIDRQKLLEVRKAVKRKLALMRKCGPEEGLKRWMKIKT